MATRTLFGQPSSNFSHSWMIHRFQTFYIAAKELCSTIGIRRTKLDDSLESIRVLTRDAFLSSEHQQGAICSCTSTKKVMLNEVVMGKNVRNVTPNGFMLTNSLLEQAEVAKFYSQTGSSWLQKLPRTLFVIRRCNALKLPVNLIASSQDPGCCCCCSTRPVSRSPIQNESHKAVMWSCQRNTIAASK